MLVCWVSGVRARLSIVRRAHLSSLPAVAWLCVLELRRLLLLEHADQLEPCCRVQVKYAELASVA